MSEETEVNFSTTVDLDLEKTGLLAFYSGLIAADRQLPPRITFYRNNKAILSITSRGFDSESIVDRNRCIMDILYLVPAVRPDLAIIAFKDPVLLSSGTQDALILIAVNNTGALAEVFPWEISDRGEVNFDKEASLSPIADGAYSGVIAHMLPVFFTAKDTAFAPSDVLGYLSEAGNEIHLYNDWTFDNIDSKCDLFV